VVMFCVQISRLLVLRTYNDQGGQFGQFLLNYFSLLNPFSTLSSAMFDLSNVQKDFAILHMTPSFAHLMSWGRMGRHVCFLVLHSLFWALLLFGSAYLEMRPSVIKSSRAAKAYRMGKELMLDEEKTQDEQQVVMEEIASGVEDIDISRMRTRILGGEYENSVVRVEDISKEVQRHTWWQNLRQFYVANRVDTFKDISEQEQDLRNNVDPWYQSNEGHVVDSTYFVVQPGECFGILGPPGSGKSTLLSLLIGEQEPSSGNVTINGHPLFSTQRSIFYRDALVSYSPPGNFFALFDNLTLLENLQLFISLRNQLQSYELNAITAYAMTKLELKPYADFPYKVLNWQLKRKLSLAIALFSGNSVAFLDEPTANLDLSSKVKLWRVIQEARQDTGIAIVLTTSSISETNTACNHYGIFVKGRFQAMGSKEYLKNRFEEGYHLKILLRDSDEQSTNPSSDDMVAILLEDDGVQEPRRRNSMRLSSTRSLDEIDEFVKDNFSNSRRLTAYGRERTYFLGVLESLAWAFDLLETNKQPLKIEQYSLSQTTLVDVFTQFARNQEIPT